jgi:hypothetical protein
MAKSVDFGVVEPRTDYNALIAESYELLRRVVRARWGYAFEFIALLGPLEDVERACGKLRAALEHGLPDRGGHLSLVTKPQRRIRKKENSLVTTRFRD